MTDIRVYRVTVEAPDGYQATALIPEEQVELFAGGTGEPFSTAAWLGYCDIWTKVKDE